MLLIETNYEITSLKADLKLAFDGAFTSGEFDSNGSYQALENSSRISIKAIGGNLEHVIDLISGGKEGLKAYLTATAEDKTGATAAPLFAQFKFFRDLSHAKVVLATDEYKVKECENVLPSTECFTSEDIAEIKLNHLDGDTEFDSHGPIVTVDCKLGIRNNNKEVWATITIDMKETIGNGTTHGNRTIEKKLWTCPAGKKITGIATEANFSFTYEDDNTGFDNYDFPVSKIINRLELKGDTGGGDLDQGEIEEEAHLHLLKFNEICVKTVPE